MVTVKCFQITSYCCLPLKETLKEHFVNEQRWSSIGSTFSVCSSNVFSDPAQAEISPIVVVVLVDKQKRK